jgi:Second Longin domain of FUZ, MON1 and HPS1
MTINPQMSTPLIKSLQQISGKVQTQNEHAHALLFLETKLLSWYSSKGAYQLAPEDILTLIILCQKTWPGPNLRSFQKKKLIPYSKSKDHSGGQRKNASSSSETESEDSDWTSTTGFQTSRENLFDDSDDFTHLESDQDLRSSKPNESQY